jgi:hypothetical protein
MEQQLHEYFHKTKTPYSYIDNKGIYNFAPGATAAAPVPQQQQQQQQPPPPPPPNQTNANPFMNMTFTPFAPSLSIFPPPPAPNLWTSIFPVAQIQAQPISTLPKSSISSSQQVVESIKICENIQHIDDIIALCDKYPLADNKKYNINMTAIHAIREPLIELSKMVGMTTIKQTIVDQIL